VRQKPPDPPQEPPVLPLVAHVPAAQIPVQQSLGNWQGDAEVLHGPASKFGVGDAQAPAVHTPVQQYAPSMHVEPSTSQAPGCGGVPKHTPSLQSPEQHPAFCVQNPPASVHAVALARDWQNPLPTSAYGLQ